jgi:hypothetical protein
MTESAVELESLISKMAFGSVNDAEAGSPAESAPTPDPAP